MAKKLIAVTNIDNGEFTPAGEPLDPTKFTKEQLEALHDAGAVRIEEVVEEPKVEEAPKAEEPKVEEPKTVTPVKAASAPVKATPSK